MICINITGAVPSCSLFSWLTPVLDLAVFFKVIFETSSLADNPAKASLENVLISLDPKTDRFFKNHSPLQSVTLKGPKGQQNCASRKIRLPQEVSLQDEGETFVSQFRMLKFFTTKVIKDRIDQRWTFFTSFLGQIRDGLTWWRAGARRDF